MATVWSVRAIATMCSGRSASRPWGSSLPSAWDPPAPRFAADAIVGVCVGFAAVEVRDQVKQAGGKWNQSRKVWELRYAQVVALKLERRIVEQASNIRYQD